MRPLYCRIDCIEMVVNSASSNIILTDIVERCECSSKAWSQRHNCWLAAIGICALNIGAMASASA